MSFSATARYRATAVKAGFLTALMAAIVLTQGVVPHDVSITLLCLSAILAGRLATPPTTALDEGSRRHRSKMNVLRPNEANSDYRTFVYGRRGTGKSTVYRRNSPVCLPTRYRQLGGRLLCTTTPTASFNRIDNPEGISPHSLRSWVGVQEVRRGWSENLVWITAVQPPE